MEDNHNLDLYPDDPKNIIPLNQIEFKQRVIRGPYQPELELYPRSFRSYHLLVEHSDRSKILV